MAPRPTLASPQTPYSLTLLIEYAHTLDSLPLDLSRNFAELRELDAVLSSSMASVNNKIHRLTDMIESRNSTRDEHLWLMGEIAEEANKVKMVGEDKIRLACQAADCLRSHYQHLTSLVHQMPHFDADMLVRKTSYPHVGTRSYLLPYTSDNSRRRRLHNAGGLLASTEASPTKRRKIYQEEDVDYANGRSPRKERQDGPKARGGRKKAERAVSPAESYLSVDSTLPDKQLKRRPGPQNGHGNASNNNHNIETLTAHKGPLAPTPSSAHPSLFQPDGYGANNNVANQHNGTQTNGKSGRGAKESTNGPSGLLEGPGGAMPRGSTQPSLLSGFSGARDASSTPVPNAVTPSAANDNATEGDNEEDFEDANTYCFCESVSYGEMVACDERDCDREWFHLACVGLTVPPKGEWFCDACRSKRANKRTARGGRRRNARARASAA